MLSRFAWVAAVLVVLAPTSFVFAGEKVDSPIVIRGDAGSPRAAVWEESGTRVEATVRTRSKGEVQMYFLSVQEMYVWLRHEYGADLPLTGFRVRQEDPEDEDELVDGETANYLYFAAPDGGSELPAVKAYHLKRHVKRDQKRLNEAMLQLSWAGLLERLAQWYEANEERFTYEEVESPLTPKQRGKSPPPPGGGRGRS
jgi:hypothetical protein